MRTRNITRAVLRRPCNTSKLEIKGPYVGLVYANEPVSGSEMEAISSWLIESGCRFAVCAGTDCSGWHDSIDMVAVMNKPSAEELVMTSWHVAEAVEDVVWFWLNLTDYDEFIFENYLALIVGEPGDLEARIMQAIAQEHLS